MVDPGTYTPTWISPSGVELALNPPSDLHWTLRAVGGLGAPPVEHITTPAPDGGSIVDWTREKDRTILWPLRIMADTHMAYLEHWREVVDLITQTRRLGPGKLRITRPDGSAREIPALYSSGLEGDPDDGNWLRSTDVVNLLCPSPWWQATTATAIERYQAPQPDYLAPYPNISSGEILGQTTLVNPGQADAWPVWTIRGPMTQVTATNNTRGETFTITYTLARGETITITSRPIQIRGPASENLIAALSLPAGRPWRLDAATSSDVVFSVIGAEAETTPGADDGTLIRLEFYPRYETA